MLLSFFSLLPWYVPSKVQSMHFDEGRQEVLHANVRVLFSSIRYPFNAFLVPNSSSHSLSCTFGGRWRWDLSRPLNARLPSEDPSKANKKMFFLFTIKMLSDQHAPTSPTTSFFSFFVKTNTNKWVQCNWRRKIVYIWNITGRNPWSTYLLSKSIIKLMTWRSLQNLNETTRST